MTRFHHFVLRHLVAATLGGLVLLSLFPGGNVRPLAPGKAQADTVSVLSLAPRLSARLDSDLAGRHWKPAETGLLSQGTSDGWPVPAVRATRQLVGNSLLERHTLVALHIRLQP